MKKYADYVYISKAIFTANTLEPINGAIAISGNTILDVGPIDELAEVIGEKTKIYDCEDKLIMPGFHDPHVHQYLMATDSNPDYTLDLSGCTSKKECLESVKKFAAAHPENPWILGIGWNNENWTDGSEYPDCTDLDELFPDRPVFLCAWDRHSAWVNKVALDMAGYTKDTPNPEGGTIERFENGDPNGMLREFPAMNPIMDVCVKNPDIKSGIVRSLDVAAEWGITSFGEVWPFGYGSAISEHEVLETFKEIEDEDQLKCRFHVYPELKEDLKQAKELRKEYKSSKLRVAGLKLMTDGTYEGHTAFSLEPYANDPTFCGSLLQDPDELRAMIINADKEGFSVRLHAIGSAAVRNALDCFEAASKENGKKAIHHAIEHVETISKEDVGRFAQLGVIASMQPAHSTCSIDTFEGIVGAKWKPYYPAKMLMDNNAIVAFGSDYPVVGQRPMDGIYAAITRQTKEGYPEGGFEPSQKVTVGQALQAYTRGSSIVMNYESQIGTLESGKLADFIILDKNLFTANPQEILETEVLLTMMDGEITFENSMEKYGKLITLHDVTGNTH